MNQVGSQEITWSDALFALLVTPPATLLVLGGVYSLLHYVFGLDSQTSWDYVVPATIGVLLALGLSFSWRNPASNRVLEHDREWLVVFVLPPALALAMYGTGLLSAGASVLLVQTIYMPVAALFFMIQLMLFMNAAYIVETYKPMGPPAEYIRQTKTQLFRR